MADEKSFRKEDRFGGSTPTRPSTPKKETKTTATTPAKTSGKKGATTQYASPIGPPTEAQRSASTSVGASEVVGYNTEVQSQIDLLMPGPQYAHGKRWVRLPNGQRILTDAAGRVDAAGNLIPGYYDLTQDPRQTYGSLNPAGRKLLTESLISAGFLDPDYATDFSSSITALTEAMDEANTLGLELDNWLQQKAAGAPRRTTGGATRTYRTTNTQDLVRIVNQVAQDTIGRKLTDDEAARFASSYQSQEVSFQKAAYGGGSVMDVPSLETSAMSFVQQARPQEEAGYKYLGYMNQLFDSIGAF